MLLKHWLGMPLHRLKRSRHTEQLCCFSLLEQYRQRRLVFTSLRAALHCPVSQLTVFIAIYAAIAQVCANAGKTVTAAPEATFSATSGGSAWPSGWSSWGGSPWFSAVSSALPGAPTGWNGTGPWGGPGAGYRGPGSGGWGPCSWSTWSGWSTGAWSTGSWPSGGPGGPHGGPNGYGPQGAPWTSFTGTWTDCSTTMAATSVPTSGVSTITTTINGQVVTGTTFQGKGAAATASGTSGAANLKGVGAIGALAVALVGTIIAL